MKRAEFLEYVRRSGGMHVFGDCQIRFCKTFTHPQYSVFNQTTRQTSFLQSIEQLLNFEVQGKPIKNWIRAYKVPFLITHKCIPPSHNTDRDEHIIPLCLSKEEDEMTDEEKAKMRFVAVGEGVTFIKPNEKREQVAYPQAKAIALRANKRVNACREYKKAYHFLKRKMIATGITVLLF